MFGDLAALGNIVEELRQALSQMLAEQQRTNKLLAEILEASRGQ